MVDGGHQADSQLLSVRTKYRGPRWLCLLYSACNPGSGETGKLLQRILENRLPSYQDMFLHSGHRYRWTSRSRVYNVP